MSVEEKFVSLEEMLVDLKNTTELMIDLAYSALIFGSKEIAKEVVRLEDYVDELRTKIELTALSIPRSIEESREFLTLIRVSTAAEEIADAAHHLAMVVLKGAIPHPILPLTETETEETITRVKVSEKSVMVGKTLEELDLAGKIGQRTIAIQRNGKWTYNPDKDTVLRANDIIITRGFAAGKKMLKDLASGALTKF